MIISTTKTHDHFRHLNSVIIMITTNNAIIILIVPLLFEDLIISRIMIIIPYGKPNEFSTTKERSMQSPFVSPNPNKLYKTTSQMMNIHNMNQIDVSNQLDDASNY
jgi:hypothetical protein